MLATPPVLSAVCPKDRSSQNGPGPPSSFPLCYLLMLYICRLLISLLRMKGLYKYLLISGEITVVALPHVNGHTESQCNWFGEPGPALL
uniref:Uncharacterized protein n=1 Tax=Anguilla anguilla TaxID=7936 RepID=A0A0E9WAU1_ANGAN